MKNTKWFSDDSSNQKRHELQYKKIAPLAELARVNAFSGGTLLCLDLVCKLHVCVRVLDSAQLAYCSPRSHIPIGHRRGRGFALEMAMSTTRVCLPSRLTPPFCISLSNITAAYLLAHSSDNNVIIYNNIYLQLAKCRSDWTRQRP